MPLSILVVDFSQAVRDSFEILGKAKGYDVMSAATARLGLECAMVDHPDVVVASCKLPDMPGVELVRLIKSRAAPPPLVFTYTGAHLLRDAALQAGADAFVLKPHVEELLVLLEQRAARTAG